MPIDLRSGTVAVPQRHPLDPARTAIWELPTLTLAVLIYASFAILTLSWSHLPLYLALPAGTWLLAWHSSLQHEVIHDHPTPWRWMNDAIAWPPIGLWMAFPVYRRAHRRHHREPWLTDPVEDPESAYLTASGWQHTGRLRRTLHRFNFTLLGRLTCGPFLTLAAVAASEAGRLLAGDSSNALAWALHGLGVVGIVVWLLWCGVSLPAYLMGCVIPSIALLRLRAFAEHRYADAPEHRTAVVEGSRVLGLLFLFNNLHAVHHRWPTVPWYRLPGVYARSRETVLARNGGLVYHGYREVFRRFLFHPHDEPVHPGGLALERSQASTG